MCRWFVMLLCCYASQSLAFTWKDLWQTQKQQAVAHFRNKEYEQAAAKFARQNTADSHYNRANA
ncbi:MAG: hypothetical protein KDH94_07480, partial [Coxiellaceae bacterium]|nr:hypothetical protein [Coxiellaceae bacterium]